MTKPKIERIKTGVPGLDRLIEGGFVKNSSTLVSGNPGSGKTIFCSQFLWEGLKNGENCMFITFEETPEKIRESAMDFGWNFKKYEDENKLTIQHKDPFREKGEDLFWFKDEIKKNEVSRVALDSVSLLSLYYRDKYDTRKNIFNLVKILENSGVTSVLTSEIPGGKEALSRLGIVEFIVDGVIRLSGVTMGEATFRSLIVVKMRRTKINSNLQTMGINEKGIFVESE